MARVAYRNDGTTPQALGRLRRSSKKNRENLVRESITALHASCRGRAARCAAALFLFIRPRSPTHPALTVFTTRFSHLAPFPVICYFSTQSPHDEQGRPMHWDPHNGKWVSGEGKEPSLRDRSFHDRDPDSPARKRAASPARASATAASLAINATSASAAAEAAKMRKGQRAAPTPLEDLVQTPVDDPDLPGWLVLQRTTNTGRSYKVYHGPNGEYAESKRQATLLASGQPISSSQLAFKSKPASGKGFGMGGSLMAGLIPGYSGAEPGARPFGPTNAVQRAGARAAAKGKTGANALTSTGASIGGIRGSGGFKGLGIPGRGEDEPPPKHEDDYDLEEPATVLLGNPSIAKDDDDSPIRDPEGLKWAGDFTIKMSTADVLPYPDVIPIDEGPPPKPPRSQVEDEQTTAASASSIVEGALAAATGTAKVEEAATTDAPTLNGAGPDVVPVEAPPADGAAAADSSAHAGSEAGAAGGGGQGSCCAGPAASASLGMHTSGASPRFSSGIHNLGKERKRSVLGPPRMDIKRSRVGEEYQAVDSPYYGDYRPPKNPPPAPPAASSSSEPWDGKTGERPDDVLTFSACIPEESVKEYLKQAAEVWAQPVAPASPRPKGKGKGNRPVRLTHGGAFGMDAMAQEKALALLHEHGYEPEAALEALRAQSKPPAACASWNTSERWLFDGSLMSHGKDFGDRARAVTQCKGGRALFL